MPLIDLMFASAECPQHVAVFEQDETLKVRFYGKLADVFGSERNIRIETPCTVAQLRQRLVTTDPKAAEALQNRRVRACIGDAIVRDDDLIPQGKVLELLAPVSGG